MSVAASFYLDIILDDEQSDPVSFWKKLAQNVAYPFLL
jgi:hypothetical protein